MISGAPDEFRLIADSAPVPMWLTGLDRVRRFVNRAYLEFLNVGYDEGRTFDWRSILHPDDQDRILAESIAGEASLKPFTLEACYRRHDGEWRYLHSVSQPSFDAAGVHDGFIGVAFDLTSLKRVEAALRQSVAEFEALAENVSQLTWMAEPDGSVFWYNRRWYEYTGTDLGLMKDWDWHQVYHPDRVDGIIEEVGANWAAGVPWEGTYQLRSAKGDYRWFLTRAEPIRNEAGELTRWFGTNTDIHSQIEAEEALSVARRAAEAKAAERSAILGQLGEGVIVTDADGRIAFVNEAARTLHGVAELNVAPSDYSDTYHLSREDGTPYPFEELPLARATMKGETVRDARWRITRPDGTQVLAIGSAQPILSVDGVQLGSVLTVRDDSKRHAAEQALRELNRTLESQVAERTAERDGMWRLSRDLMIVLDPRLRMLAINPACAELTGYTADEVTGHTFKRFIHPEDWPTAIAAIRAGRRAPVREVEARLIHRDGSLREFVWSASPEAGRAYVSGRDVSEERTRQRALFAAQEALRAAQKLDAIGQLTGGVAHDFNNLLSPIIGTLDLLKKRETGEERTTRMIDAAQQSAERARLLVQRLLTFARRQPLQLQPVDLAALVVGLRDLIHSTLGPEIALGIEIAGAVPPVTADPGQLETAILNLAANARDAMQATGQEGRRLTVLLAPDEADDAAPFVVLEVTDNGAGMDEATLTRATDPFFSGKGLGRGSGLGLSMVDGLTAQLGGTMEIESEPGVGTTVRLRLPASAGHVAAGLASATGEVADDTLRGHVLLVEDEPLVRMATAELLRDSGFEVSEAASGEAALALFEAGGQFDCMVTDHLMPGITGVELARKLRASHPGLPVMLLSGYAELDSFGSELPYMGKPYRADDLVAKVSALAGRKSLPTVN